MNLSSALVIAALGASALGGVWWHGHQSGARACEARHEVARRASEHRMFRLAEELSRAAIDLDQAREALRARALEAEDAARANSDPCRIPAADSLLRLRTRWAAD